MTHTEVRAGTCENCDRPDDELLAVHRVYLDPDEGKPLEVLEELEWWCFSCRSQYPHDPV